MPSGMLLIRSFSAGSDSPENCEASFWRQRPRRPLAAPLLRLTGRTEAVGRRGRIVDGRRGRIVLRDGAGNIRTRTLIPGRIHGGDRDAVDRGSRQTRHLDADRLVGWRVRGRARDLKEGAAGARCVGCAVVKAVEGELCQRTSIGVRGGRGPGGSEDAGVARGGHQEDSVERQSDRAKPADTPRTKPFCILSSHELILPRSNGERAKGNKTRRHGNGSLTALRSPVNPQRSGLLVERTSRWTR